jgi:hypothetical protein
MVVQKSMFLLNSNFILLKLSKAEYAWVEIYCSTFEKAVAIKACTSTVACKLRFEALCVTIRVKNTRPGPCFTYFSTKSCFDLYT